MTLLTVDDYLDHMGQSVEDVRSATAGLDFAGFKANRVAQLAVIKAIENIGEAARGLTRDHPAFVDAEPGIAWRNWIAVRNRLAHGYFDIDLGIVWQLVDRNIDELAKQLDTIAPQPI